jgi:hypothetical protein
MSRRTVHLAPSGCRGRAIEYFLCRCEEGLDSRGSRPEALWLPRSRSRITRSEYPGSTAAPRPATPSGTNSVAPRAAHRSMQAPWRVAGFSRRLGGRRCSGSPNRCVGFDCDLETKTAPAVSSPCSSGEARYLACAFLAGRDQVRIALLPSSDGIRAALRARDGAGSSRLTERNSRPASVFRFHAPPSSTWPGWPSTSTR